MTLRIDPARAGEALPPRADVVVVGGGIVGASAALFLARRGISTVLCEKGIIGGEQSGRNWGWCRKMGRDPRELPLIIGSMRLWQGMNDLVGAETGFRTTGIMYLCATPGELAAHEAWLEDARPYQLDSRVITAAEAAALLPPSMRSWAGALYTPSDGGAEPELATRAIAEAAQRHGAAIAACCAVRGVETAAGQVSAAITERGRIACQAVILAGGVWSRLFCGNLGIELPQLKVLGSVSRTETLPGGPEVSLAAPEFGFRKRLDGGYILSRASATVSDVVPDTFRLMREFLPMLRVHWKELRIRIGNRFLEEWRIPRRWALDVASPFERVRVLDPEPVRAMLGRAQRDASAAYPFFRDARIAASWGGLIDVTPDAVPVISAVDALPGFYLATGFSGHGFGIGPGAGQLIADLVTGDAPHVNPTPFRFDRFSSIKSNGAR